MTATTHPIGVFDSGMGGLTVLQALRHVLPQESFLYLGDTARLPYGTKSLQTVRQYALQMAKILVQRKIKALVIACNTATTAALPTLQATFPEIPVIGVIEAGTTLAVNRTKNQHIFILATETTIASHAYQDRILKQLPQANLTARAANLLVAVAEEGLTNHPIAVETLKYYLSELKTDDTLLLGCTHFPVFIPTLQTLFPTATLINPAEATAIHLKQTLSDCDLLNTQSSPSMHYLVTDSVARFRTVGQLFLKDSLQKTEIELIDA